VTAVPSNHPATGRWDLWHQGVRKQAGGLLNARALRWIDRHAVN